MSPNRITWLSPADAPDSFPDVEYALSEPDGLLAAGGDLSSERLLAAYRSGIFPWYEEGQPILWWSPDPRCILQPGELHISRRLAQQLRKTTLTLRFNTAFPEVLQACAGPRKFQRGTWITSDMATAYERLHTEGWAHSIEIWDGETLAGGLYGLCIGRVFFGESMFSAATNASKMALLGLTTHMLERGLELIDCQVVSQHLTTLGARTIPRTEFAGFLKSACDPPSACEKWPREPLPVSSLVAK